MDRRPAGAGVGAGVGCDADARDERGAPVGAVGRRGHGSRGRARFVGRNKHEAFGEWETTSTVVACEPGRVFSWAVGDPDEPSAVWRFGLAPGNGGTELSQWMRMGPGRSGLSFAIDAMPEKEQKIVFVRLREFERGMTSALEHIRQWAEA
ncbi:hypothetical protein SAFG77S_08867 [Streptomyces afghaniensis]